MPSLKGALLSVVAEKERKENSQTAALIDESLGTRIYKNMIGMTQESSNVTTGYMSIIIINIMMWKRKGNHSV